MRQWGHWGALLLVIGIAVALRLRGFAWDEGFLFHPDERFLVAVAGNLAWPEHWPAAVEITSPLNPFWDQAGEVARRFPYGHLPLYLVRVLAPLVPSYVASPLQGEPLIGAGRILALGADTVTVIITYRLTKDLYGEFAGVLAAAAVAVTVLHVQQAHFYTADIVLTPFVLGVLLWLVGLVGRTDQERRGRQSLAAGMLFGMALGTKITAALLIVPVLVTHLLPVLRGSSPASAGALWRRLRTDPTWGWFGPTLLIAGCIFVVTNPFALLDWRMFLQSLAVEAGIARGRWVPPYAVQYYDTVPYVYPLIQQARWMLGLPLFLLAWTGVGWLTWRAFRREVSPGEVVLLAWVLPAIAVIGGAFTKYPRYWLPIVPVLFVAGSGWLARRRYHFLLTAAVLVPSVAYVLAFTQIYTERHPWIQTSAWLYRHVPAGATLVNERWDHALPIPLTVDGKRRSPEAYRYVEVDSFARPEALVQALERADVVVLASPRVWRVITRYPDRYPAAPLYRTLLANDSNFQIARIWRVEPMMGPVSLRANPFAEVGVPAPPSWHDAAPAPVTLDLGPADESFSVYDHPLVIVLTTRLTD